MTPTPAFARATLFATCLRAACMGVVTMTTSFIILPVCAQSSADGTVWNPAPGILFERPLGPPREPQITTTGEVKLAAEAPLPTVRSLPTPRPLPVLSNRSAKQSSQARPTLAGRETVEIPLPPKSFSDASAQESGLIQASPKKETQELDRQNELNELDDESEQQDDAKVLALDDEVWERMLDLERENAMLEAKLKYQSELAEVRESYAQRLAKMEASLNAERLERDALRIRFEQERNQIKAECEELKKALAAATRREDAREKEMLEQQINLQRALETHKAAASAKETQFEKLKEQWEKERAADAKRYEQQLTESKSEKETSTKNQANDRAGVDSAKRPDEAKSKKPHGGDESRKKQSSDSDKKSK